MRTSRRAGKQARPEVVPKDLEERLVEARLDLRALFRVLDEQYLAQDVPAALRGLFELDADFAEALWVLGQRRGSFNLAAMARYSLASLSALPVRCERFLGCVEARARAVLLEHAQQLRKTLEREEAYRDLPVEGK